MKKILSFVLVLAMVLGSVSMAFATSYPDVADTADYAEAVNVLTSLGVIEGYNDGTFKPTKTITRAEAIKIVVAALGIPVDESGKTSYSTPFEDVPATAWYAGYVRYGVALGITEGTSATRFSPDATVTYDQVITFIMRALGYSDKLVGGYPTGYIMQAYKLGILDSKSNTGSAPAPRGEIAMFLYNALDENFVTYSKDDDEFHAISRPADGCMNMYARLGAVPEVDEKTGDAIYTVIDSTVLENAKADIAEYFGASAQLIKNKKGDILGVADVETIFVDGSTTKKIGDYELATDADKNAVVITNGESAATATAIELKQTNDKFAVVLKNGKVSRIVSQQIWNVNATAKISEDEIDEMDLANETKAHELLGKKFVLNEDKTINMSSFILAGVKSLADIKKDNIVYVYENSKGISKVEVGTDVTTAKLTEINSAMDKYTIGGTKYELVSEAAADAAVNKDNVADYSALKALLDKNVDAYLAYDGTVYFAQAHDDSEDTPAYAVVLDGQAAETEKLVNAAGILRVFTAEGKQLDYELTKDVTVVVTGAGDTKDITATYKDATATPGTLVKLTINKDGKVSAFEAIGKIGSETTDITKKGNVVKANAVVNSKSIIFSYTGTNEVKDLRASKNYSVISYSTLLGQTKLPYAAATDAKKSNVEAMLVAGKDITTSNLTYVVFTGFSEIKDGYKVNFLEDGVEVSYTMAAKPTELSTNGASAYTLEFDAKDVATVNSEKTLEGTPAKAGDTSKTATSLVSENVLKDATGKLFDVDSEIEVYTVTTKGVWSPAKGTSKLSGLKAEENIYLYDTNDDKIFDLAVIQKVK